jgi:hypothetical protein
MVLALCLGIAQVTFLFWHLKPERFPEAGAGHGIGLGQGMVEGHGAALGRGTGQGAGLDQGGVLSQGSMEGQGAASGHRYLQVDDFVNGQGHDDGVKQKR